MKFSIKNLKGNLSIKKFRGRLGVQLPLSVMRALTVCLLVPLLLFTYYIFDMHKGMFLRDSEKVLNEIKVEFEDYMQTSINQFDMYRSIIDSSNNLLDVVSGFSTYSENYYFAYLPEKDILYLPDSGEKPSKDYLMDSPWYRVATDNEMAFTEMYHSVNNTNHTVTATSRVLIGTSEVILGMDLYMEEILGEILSHYKPYGTELTITIEDSVLTSGEHATNDKYTYHTAIVELMDGITVEAKVDSELILKPIVQKSAVLLVFLALSMIVIAFRLRFMLGKIAKDVVNVLYMTDKMANNDLTGEITTHSNNEISTVVDNINNLNTALKDNVNARKQLSNRLSNITTVIREQSETTTVNMKGISNSVEEVTIGTVSQSENLANISMVANEVSVKIDTTVAGLQEVVKSAEDTVELSKKGLESNVELVKSLNTGKHSLAVITGKIKHLLTALEDVSEQNKLLDEINSKVNLLALNASIEAAKAGQEGRAFAVIAQEIKILSEMTKSANSSVKLATGEVIIYADQVDSSLKEVTTDFLKVNESSKVTTESFHLINKSNVIESQQLSDTSMELTKLTETLKGLLLDVTNISAISQESTALLEEVSSQTELQVDIVSVLDELVSELNSITHDSETQLARYKL